MALLLFGFYTVLSGFQQGIITFLFREFVAPKWGEWIDAALHHGGILIYALLVGYVLRVDPHAALWPTVAGAVLLRIALFDPAHNAARAWFSHREGRRPDPLLAVGTSALSDKVLQWVASLVKCNVSVLSAGLRLLALAGAVWVGLYK